MDRRGRIEMGRPGLVAVALFGWCTASSPAIAQTKNTPGWQPRPLPPGIKLQRQWFTSADHGFDTPQFLDDLDADGWRELLLGTPRATTGGMLGVDIVSGRTGRLLRRHTGALPGDHFGASAAVFDDVDHDGCRDYAIAAPDEATAGGARAGVVRWYSSRTAALLRQRAGAYANQQLGRTVQGLPDRDGDGLPEAALRSAVPDLVRLEDAQGNLYHTFQPAINALLSGPERLGDFDRDGIDDFAIAEYTSSHHYVEIHSSRNASHLYTLSTGISGDGFGFGTIALGDVDGDGADDLACGAPYTDLYGPGSDNGVVRLFSGATGTLIGQVAGGPYDKFLGYSQAAVGDWNGDGIVDFASGLPRANSDAASFEHGMVRILSGADLSTLAEIDGPLGRNWAAGLFGWIVVAADLDANGREDLIVGAPGSRFTDLHGNVADAGAFFVYLR